MVRRCLPAMFAILREVIASQDDALVTEAFEVFDDLVESVRLF